MKLLKYGLFGILLGEITVLLVKDNYLQKKLHKKSSYEKVELVTKEVVNINKSAVLKIQKMDMQKTVDSITEFLNIKEENLNEILQSIRLRSKENQFEVVDDLFQSFSKK